MKRERPDSFPVGGGGGAARCTPGEAAAGRPPFLARNSALVAEPAAAAAHTVRLLLLLPALLHTCVASCQAGSRLQSVRIILARDNTCLRGQHSEPPCVVSVSFLGSSLLLCPRKNQSVEVSRH